MYSFKPDYTYTFSGGIDASGKKGEAWFEERGTYDFDGKTLMVRIHDIANSLDGPIKPQISWQRYSFERDKDMATVALQADDAWMPGIIEGRKKFGGPPYEAEHWVPVPFGSH